MVCRFPLLMSRYRKRGTNPVSGCDKDEYAFLVGRIVPIYESPEAGDKIAIKPYRIRERRASVLSATRIRMKGEKHISDKNRLLLYRLYTRIAKQSQVSALYFFKSDHFQRFGISENPDLAKITLLVPQFFVQLHHGT